MIPPQSLTRSNRRAQCALGGFFGFVAVAALIQMSSPGKGGIGLEIFSGLFAVACVGIAIRAAVAHSIKASPEGVRIRSLLQTQKYRWSEITRFRVAVARVGAVAYRRRVLAVDLKDGSSRQFGVLNDTPDQRGWVDEAAETLNRYVPK